MNLTYLHDSNITVTQKKESAAQTKGLKIAVDSGTGAKTPQGNKVCQVVLT